MSRFAHSMTEVTIAIALADMAALSAASAVSARGFSAVPGADESQKYIS